jgi:hypothetical protein
MQWKTNLLPFGVFLFAHLLVISVWSYLFLSIFVSIFDLCLYIWSLSLYLIFVSIFYLCFYISSLSLYFIFVSIFYLCLYIWSFPEIRNSGNVNIFKRKMKILPYYLGWSDRKLNIIHSKLRNMCSSLSADLLLVNWKLNPAVYLFNVLVRWK